MKSLRLAATAVLFCAAELACAQSSPPGYPLSYPVKPLERSADTPRGGDARFAPTADIIEKFEKLAVHALPKPKVARLRDAVMSLEQLPDAAELAALMKA